MANLKKWLDELGFDWEYGTIIYQPVKEDKDYQPCPGWASADELEQPMYISKSAAILSVEFDDGFGSPQCPRVLAADANAIYFPKQYDGSTSLVKIITNLDYYLSVKGISTPYPGGG